MITNVPGVIEFGKLGLWYPPPWAMKEHSRPIVFFFRDKNISSTNSVLAVNSFALDTPTLTPWVVAWEGNTATPPSPPDEEPGGIIDSSTMDASALLRLPVTSRLEKVVSATYMVLTEAEDLPDFIATDLEQKAHQGVNRRMIGGVTQDGFGQNVFARLLVPNSASPTYVYGVTERGTTPNQTRTNGRYIWHSEQNCVEELVRRRTPKDYAYVSKKKHNVGGNNPNIFVIYTKNGRLQKIIKGGFLELCKEYDRIRKKLEKKEKEDILRAKMAAVEHRAEAMAQKEKLIERDSNQREREATMKMGQRRIKTTMDRWEKRLKNSYVIAKKAEWELRKHKPSLNDFYYNSTLYTAEAFSYDSPDDWEEAGAHSQQQDGSNIISYAAGSLVQVAESDSLQESFSGEEEGLSSAAPGKRSAEKLEEILDSLADNETLIEKLADKLGSHSFVPLLRRDQTIDPLHRELEEDDR